MSVGLQEAFTRIKYYILRVSVYVSLRVYVYVYVCMCTTGYQRIPRDTSTNVVSRIADFRKRFAASKSIVIAQILSQPPFLHETFVRKFAVRIEKVPLKRPSTTISRERRVENRSNIYRFVRSLALHAESLSFFFFFFSFSPLSVHLVVTNEWKMVHE